MYVSGELYKSKDPSSIGDAIVTGFRFSFIEFAVQRAAALTARRGWEDEKDPDAFDEIEEERDERDERVETSDTIDSGDDAEEVERASEDRRTNDG